MSDPEEITDDHSVRCHHCDRVVDRASAALIETPIDRDDGRGYDMIAVPWCRRCQLKFYGHECGTCGELYLDLEDAALCCYEPDKRAVLPDGGHPEPVEGISFPDSEVDHVDYLLWSHGASNALRARVTAEMRGERPPEWSVDEAAPKYEVTD